MPKLDPQLTFLKSVREEEGAEGMRAIVEDPSTAVDFAPDSEEGDDNPIVRIIVRFSGEIDSLVDVGFEPQSIVGDIATGSIRVDQLDALEEVAELERAEAAVQLSPSLDLSVPDVKGDQVHSGPPGYRGNGVVMGIVDSGADYTHGNFRNSIGRTRIKRIWDQNLSPASGESNPSGFSYGVEYDNAEIDAAMGTANPFAQVRHQDSGINHGTHVTGIAAGDGSEPDASGSTNDYIGMAPESDIVVVATDFSTTGVIDGVNYIFQKARELGQPAVVNLSLGSVIGPHDGTSNFEQGITNLITGKGRAVVAAAGNEGSDNAHASNTVGSVPTTLTVNVPTNRRARVILDLWYDGSDALGVNLQDPTGNSTGNIPVGGTVVNTWNGNTIQVSSETNNPNNGDKRIFVIIQPPAGGSVTPGSWQLQLTGVTINVGTFNVWIYNPPSQPLVRFPAAQATSSGTVSSPATANRVIVAGSYITSGAGIGSLSSFSNRGPTRDGRPAPDVAAPGQRITSANALASSSYQSMSGTSMASPHVAGTVALMLQKNNDYTWSEIRDCLRNSARDDSFTGVTPNNAFGWGKLDALAAVGCVRGPRPPWLTRFGPRCRIPTRNEPMCFVTRFGSRCELPTRNLLTCLYTRVGRHCPVPTRVGRRCPVPTRTEPNCPVLPTRDDPNCPLPSRNDPRCPLPTRVGPLCGFAEQQGQGGAEQAEDRRSTGEEDALMEAYEQGFSDGYAQAYQDFYGTYDTGEQTRADDDDEFYDYDESWFDPNEFE